MPTLLATPRAGLSLLPPKAALVPARSPAATTQAVVEPVRADDLDSPMLAGCGWFDSSFELRQGLQVIELSLPEHWPLDSPSWAHQTLDAR